MDENTLAAGLPANININDGINEGMLMITTYGMSVLGAILILLGGVYLGKWAQKTIGKIDRLDGTLRSFLGGLAKYAIFAIAIVAVLGQFGVQTASLLAVLGAAGLAIGLALQGTLSNVASGVMLLILRPFNVGDYISAGGVEGTVKSLGLFGTELATPDNVYIFSPNSQIWNSDIKNFSRNTQRRIDFTASISYDDDINKAFKTLEKVAKAEKRLITTSGKEPMIAVAAMAESSVDIKVRVWMKASDYWDVYFDMHKAIKEALDKDGFTIPFPTQTVEMIPSNVKVGAKAA